MTSSDLSKYMGGKIACDICKHPFEEGKLIMVDPIDGHVFCYSGVLDDSCMEKHVVVTGKVIRTYPMTFSRPLDESMESVRRILDDWE